MDLGASRADRESGAGETASHIEHPLALAGVECIEERLIERREHDVVHDFVANPTRSAFLGPVARLLGIGPAVCFIHGAEATGAGFGRTSRFTVAHAYPHGYADLVEGSTHDHIAPCPRRRATGRRRRRSGLPATRARRRTPRSVVRSARSILGAPARARDARVARGHARGRAVGAHPQRGDVGRRVGGARLDRARRA